MNGRDLIESMGHVDEKYIAEAEEAPKRRHWQTAAITAACLALVLAGVWQFQPAQKSEQADEGAPAVMTAGTARSLEETAAENGFSAAAPMMAGAPVRMTVRVVEQTEEALICVVTDPGTSDYQTDDRVRITLPEADLQETAAQPAALDAESEPPQYEVSFLPDQGSDTITPTQWIPLEANK